MEYIQGKTGRVFVIRFDEGDDVSDGISRLAVREKIKAASFQILGAIADQKLVVGSRMSRRGRNVPDFLTANGEWEIIGFGTLFRRDGPPKIHLHAAAGKKRRTLVGCMRGAGKVYITVECILSEIVVSGVGKDTNSAGLSLISFKRGKKC